MPDIDVHSASTASAFRRLTDQEREASLHLALTHWDGNQDVWVFGYGSLVWRPEFDFLEQRTARLHGYHRALCLWSRINRGTPEKPGLVFGLDRGGSCRGMAFKIAAHTVPTTLQALWRREMPSGAYIPKWLACYTDQGIVKALTFTMNRNNSAYVRDLPAERLISIVKNAHGSYGPCVEYVLETADALKLVGVHDAKLDAIVRQLRHIPQARP